MAQRLIPLLVESFWKILLPGLTVAIPLTIVSFALALIIATGTALVQYARIPVLRHIARFYIWIVRGTPLLVQLYVIFYGLPKLGVVLEPLPAATIVFALNSAPTMRRPSAPRWNRSPGGSWKRANALA